MSFCVCSSFSYLEPLVHVIVVSIDRHVYKHYLHWNAGEISTESFEVIDKLFAIAHARTHLFLQEVAWHDFDSKGNFADVVEILELRQIIEHESVLADGLFLNIPDKILQVIVSVSRL